MEDLLKKIETYKKEINEFITDKQEEAEAFRIKYLGTKGLVKDIMGGIKEVANEKKKEFGLRSSPVFRSPLLSSCSICYPGDTVGLKKPYTFPGRKLLGLIEAQNRLLQHRGIAEFPGRKLFGLIEAVYAGFDAPAP